GAGIVEGNCTSGDCSAIVNPILALRRDEGQCVIGGWVYRADPASMFYGVYIFADYQLKKLFGMRLNAAKTGVEEFGVISSASVPGYISALGHDGAGGYYAAMYNEAGAVAQRKTQIWRLKHAELRPGPATAVNPAQESRTAAHLRTRPFSPDRAFSLDGKRRPLEASGSMGEEKDLLILRDRRTGRTRKWISLPGVFGCRPAEPVAGRGPLPREKQAGLNDRQGYAEHFSIVNLAFTCTIISP